MTKELSQADIKRLFHKTYKRALNFMTPEVLSYGRRKNYIYELSKGKGLWGADLFGVTVLHKDGSKSSLSTSFAKKQAALDFIRDLGRE